MSPFLFSADLGVTELGRQARKQTTVGDVHDQHIADLFADYADAVKAGDFARMGLVREYARTLDESLVDELDGFDYPAAA